MTKKAVPPNNQLEQLIRANQDYIFSEMQNRLARLPESNYQKFARSLEGYRRIHIWIENITKAVGGEPDLFFTDTEKIGYLRAHQGFNLDFIMQFYRIFKQIVWELVQAQTTGLDGSVTVARELHQLSDILFQGLGRVTASYLTTREEIINEKVSQLQLLAEFTQNLITKLEIPEIARFVLPNVTSILDIAGCMMAVFREGQTADPEIYPDTFSPSKELQSCILQSQQQVATLYRSPLHLQELGIAEGASRAAMFVPMVSRGRTIGVLVLYLKSSEFDFETNRRDLVNQLLYIIAIALENAFMMEQIQRSRIEMQSLAGNTITIQEEERKRVAADIHDTITQSLTGIGYKIQFCQEMARTDPRQLQEQLDLLLKTVHDAINQCREMISSLRPDLIDTLGLIPALEKYLQAYEKETGVEVISALPEAFELSPEIKICLFRVVQEGLMNVYKHARTKKVWIELKRAGSSVRLVISDEGKGFDLQSIQYHPRRRQHLGMLIIRERIEAVKGKLNIKSAENKGCRLDVNIPI